MKYASVRVFTFLAAATAVALMCLGQAAVVHAQSSRLKANIPFDFYVGREILPAGTYEVKLIAGSVIQLMAEKGSVVAGTSTIPVPNRSREPGSKLVFNRYGNDHFLSEVLWSGYSNGRGLIKSPVEIQIAKNTARKRVVEPVVGP